MSALVGLIGKKRVGKDSFAATLVAEHYFRRFAFADPLKRAALRLPVPILDTLAGKPRYRTLQDVVREHGWEGAKEITAVRRLLQEFGVGIREVQPDFWIRATMDRVHAEREVSPVVVTDVRFPNEAQEIRDAGGYLVRIIRHGRGPDDTHESETALDSWSADFEVLNDGTLENLQDRARFLARGYFL